MFRLAFRISHHSIQNRGGAMWLPIQDCVPPYSTLTRSEKVAISNRNKINPPNINSSLKNSFHRSAFLKAHNKIENALFLPRDYIELSMNSHLKVRRSHHLELHLVSQPEMRKQSFRRSAVNYARVGYPGWLVFEHGTAADYFPA